MRHISLGVSCYAAYVFSYNGKCYEERFLFKMPSTEAFNARRKLQQGAYILRYEYK